MPPLSLDVRDAITIITGIVTIAGVIFALRSAVAKLEVGQGEVLRQLGALHKRMDLYGERISAGEVNHARMDERIKGIRESQQFYRRARLEAERAGQPPIFAEEENG